MQKIFLLSIIFINWSVNRLAKPAHLGYSFGNKGIVAGLSKGNSEYGKAAIQKDGKAIVVDRNSKGNFVTLYTTEGKPGEYLKKGHILKLRVSCAVKHLAC